MLGPYKNARISVSGGTDISGRPARAAAARRRRQHEPAEHDRAGARHRSAAALLRRSARARQGRSPASPTPTPASRRRSRSCASPSIASARPTSACRSSPCRPACGRSSEARKCRSSRTATSSTVVLHAPRRAVPPATRRRWATCSSRPAAAGWCACQDVAAPDDGERAGVDRALQPDAPVLGECQPRPRTDDARRGPDGGPRARSASWG